MSRQHGSPTLAAPLFRIEEEDPVLNDRSIEIEPVVVVAKNLFGLTSLIEKEISRIKSVIPKKLKNGTVETVRTTFGYQVDDGALRLAELSTKAIALDAKLRNSINGWEDQQRCVRTYVHVIDAVNGPHIRVRLVAVDRHVHMRIKPRAASGKAGATNTAGCG